MNTIIKQLTQHATCRDFADNYAIAQQDLQQIITASKQAPSWSNGQAYSIVILNDNSKKQQFADLVDSLDTTNKSNADIISQCSVFMLYCLDLSKNQLLTKQQLDFDNSLEPLLITTVDASLALQNAVVAAESLDLGTTVIGGLRRLSKELIDFFNLPKYVFPLAGISIGKPAKINQVKPRLPDSVNVFYNSYNSTQYNSQTLEDYSDNLQKFASKSGYFSKNWLEWSVNYYGAQQYPQSTAEILIQQGIVSGK